MKLTHIRVALFVAANFLSLGIYLPFFPLMLAQMGFDARDVTLLLAIPLGVKVCLTPFVMAGVDVWKTRRQAAIVYAVMAALAFSCLPFVTTFGMLAILMCVFGVFWTTLIPLGDAFALTEVRFTGGNYGAIRLWGSLSFILANLAGGVWLSALGADGIHLLILSCLVLTALLALWLPVHESLSDQTPATTHIGKVFSFSDQWRNAAFVAIAVSSGLVQSSHALLYGLGTLHWSQRGFTTGEIGLFWAIGVLAEVLLFTQARRVFASVPPVWLLALGAVAAGMRWAIHDHAESFGLILALQTLHGLSFGATFLATQSYLASRMSEEETPRAQGFLVFVAAISMALMTALSGAFYELLGGQTFYLMAVVAFCGLLPLILVVYPQRVDAGG